MRILLWHVHGSWTTAFVQGHHDYVVPVTPQRDADGLGRARTWDWPANVIECTPEQLAHEDIDIVVLQRPSELDLTQRWLGRRPGRDVPAVYLEHNAPEPHPVHSVHPLARGGDITIVHVTHFNRLFWGQWTSADHCHRTWHRRSRPALYRRGAARRRCNQRTDPTWTDRRH